MSSSKPYPIKTLGVAVAFSPRVEALLHEARHLAEKLDVDEVVFIHVGEKNQIKVSRLEDLISRSGFTDKNYRIVWEEGKKAESILEVCEQENVSLLVLGAHQKEGLYKFYLGSVARKVARDARNSVLLLIEPKNDGQDFKRLVVSGLDHPKTRSTINTALYFAKAMHSREVTIIEEVRPSKIDIAVVDDLSLNEATRVRRSLRNREHDRVENIIKTSDNTEGLNINEKCIFGKPGYTIGHYAEANKADLLVVNSPDEQLKLIDRFFPHDIEYILSDLPTNVLIVHGENENDKPKD